MPTIQTRDNTEISNRDWGTEQLFAFIYGRLLSAGVLRRCIFLTRVLCLIVSLVATISNAQELPAATANAARPASGWWSPVRAESATAPQLQISRHLGTPRRSAARTRIILASDQLLYASSHAIVCGKAINYSRSQNLI